MARKNITNEMGYTGLIEWQGVIQEDFLRELRGKEGYKRYNEMRLNSPIVGALLLAAEQSIRGVQWQYVSDLSTEDQEDPRVEFLQENLDNMNHTWGDHVIEALSMLPFGYSPFEICYKREGGQLRWRKFAIRGQDTVYGWGIDKNGGIESMTQHGAPKYELVEIPIEKMVLYRTRREKNNPEGRSILRTAWVSYYYAKNIMQIEAIGIERDLAGMPVITPPQGASTDESDSTSDVSKAAKIVRNVRNDQQAGIVLPPPNGEGEHNRWKFELASTGGTRQFDTNAIVMRYESRILMSALAQFLILGQDKVGSQALSTDMTSFWTMAVNSIADIVADTHTRYAAHRLLELNGMDTDDIRMEHSPAGDIDLTLLGDFFQKAGDKITWMPTDEIWLRGIANMPEIDVDQITEERERKEATAERIMQSRQRPQDDEMSATEYTVDDSLPPDNDERLSFERNTERTMKQFFSGQKKRIIKAVKK